MAATRTEERLFASMGLPNINPVRFEACSSIAYGGVMLLLPFLLECGLLSYRNHYRQRQRGYYNFDGLFILMAFAYLCRIKSFEATKHLNVGDWGKMIGGDRIPEVKKLRGLVYEITDQKQCDAWMAELSELWIKKEEPELYYIDGHVKTYHGYLAQLGKKHVSRQQLCLPGMMEFWINSFEGMPYFVVTAQVNEKMIEMLESEIIPRLLELHPVSEERKQQMRENLDYPLFTIVFDREGYSPALFKRLWENHRIAVITYRKNVNDKWDESDFEKMKIDTYMGQTDMELCEKELTLDGCPLREVRKLSADGAHQCSIITTNRIICMELIAIYMFGRWIQENFFRYLRQEYAIDKIIQYGIEQIDDDFKVVNREYSNITYKIKKSREKLSRKEAKLYNHELKIPNGKKTGMTDMKNKNENENENGGNRNEDERAKKMNQWIIKQAELLEQIAHLEQDIKELVGKRSKIPYKIPVSEMPQETRYNKIDQESKHLQNIVKMICYRAETAFANLLAPHFARSRDEIRALVKSVIMQTIDLVPDYENNRLEVTLYPLTNRRSNEAVEKIIHTINKCYTRYPGTDLDVFYKMVEIKTP